jgi:Fur family ferric uptake transcriptional regulator
MPARRNTQQRAAIFHALESTGRPLTAEQIHAEAKRRARGLGIATVYRNLRTMVDEGRLVTVELPGEPARYEVAGKEHHHHFVCERCDRVFEIDVCASNLEDMIPKGFLLERHEVILYGRCVDCQ